MSFTAKLRIGTRASALARWQADWVGARLEQFGVDVEIVRIATQGDLQAAPIAQIGGQGLFTKQIQQALLEGVIDLAVHSLKDLPTAPIDGLVLAAVPQRESSRDVFVSNTAASLAELPFAARVGTGSMRRRAQLLFHRPDLHVRDIRGNVDTRLRKLDEGQYDGIILAEAGLRRLGLVQRISQIIAPSDMLPAVGQGALGLESRASDADTLKVVSQLDHTPTHRAVQAERAMLARLRAGCLAPVGAWGRVENDFLRLDAAVVSVDGRQRIFAAGTAPAADAAQLGEQIARQLLDDGAGDVIRSAHA